MTRTAAIIRAELHSEIARLPPTKESLDADVRTLLAALDAAEAEAKSLRASILAEVDENDRLKGHMPSNFGIGSGAGPQTAEEIWVFAEERRRVNRECAFYMVERELREAGASTVSIMYWDRGASETLSVHAPRGRQGHGTLLTALDALKVSP